MKGLMFILCTHRWSVLVSERKKVTFPTMLHLVKIYRHLQTNKKNVQIEHINYRIESLNITPIYFLGIILASNVKTSNKKRKKM